MISVCMATYNGEKYIKQQIQSILLQLESCDELIVSDNGSSDNTIIIIESINDKRIKLFTNNITLNNKYYNIVNNFNNAIIHSSGKFIFLSDQDDLWLPGKVEMMKNDLEKYSCVISNYNIIDKRGDIILDEKYKESPLTKKILVFVKFPFLGCSMAFTRDFFYSYCYPFPQKIILHDIWIGTLAFAKRSLYFDSEVLLSYRMHEDNATTASKGKSTKALLFKIKYRLYLYICLFFRLITKR